jgi:hypothetical protein
MQDKLYWAPVRAPQAILDVGTGTGEPRQPIIKMILTDSASYQEYGQLMLVSILGNWTDLQTAELRVSRSSSRCREQEANPLDIDSHLCQ